jgi:two-component system chemotaxis response regulator CheB
MRLLIADGSALYRKLFSSALEALPDLQISLAQNWEITLKLLDKRDIDIIFVDAHLPGISVDTLVEAIQKYHEHTHFVVLCDSVADECPNAVRVMECGARHCLAKPKGTPVPQAIEELRPQVTRLVTSLKLRPKKLPLGDNATSFSPNRSSSPHLPPPFPEILLIGSSTGGPAALGELIGHLPKPFPAPVLVVQHIPARFLHSLVDHLDRQGPLRVREATEGQTPTAGEVYFAPGGRHLELLRKTTGALQLHLSDANPVNCCRPSVDVLFESAAHCSLKGVVAVILTGMGCDGAEGTASLQKTGPLWCIAQDAATSVVYGMPGAIANRSLADQILPLKEIAPRLKTLFHA